MEPETSPTNPTTSARFPWWRIFVYAFGLLGFIGIMAWSWIQTLHYPPANFPSAEAFVIEPGAGLRTVTADLYQAGFIRSRWLFYSLFTQEFDPRQIRAGRYRFEQPLSARDIAQRIVAGGERPDLLRLTFIEGERVTQFAARAHTVIPDFDIETFITLATPYEGQLFPDTYVVPPDFTAEQLFTLLRETYTERMAPLQSAIANHQLSEMGIITLASIVEREANTPESKGLVAGILLDRLTIGMPLQADASIEYVLDKPLSELTPADLRIDSPYNTYLNRGLPPTPIGNPGLTAIMAVLEPTPSDYLFYITGRDGNFYYARTYEEHQRNIARYLR